MPPPPHPTLLDRSLVRRALCGEQSALDHLIERLDCIERLVHDQPLSTVRFTAGELDRIVQDSLKSIWAHLHDYDGRIPLETWAANLVATQVHRATAAHA
ncbi:MAG: hypothetical protein AAF726_25335 [Planctomycetota bacterium]